MMPSQKLLSILKQLLVVVPALVAIVVLYVTDTRSAEPVEKGYELGAYEPVLGWPQPPDPGWTWGRTSGVWPDSPDRVFVIQDGQLPVIKTAGMADTCTTTFDVKTYAPDCETEHKSTWGFLAGARVANQALNKRWQKVLSIYDGNGKLITTWDNLNECCFVRPHIVRVDPYDPRRPVWMGDAGMDTARKFSQDGKLLMTIGEAPAAGEAALGRVSSRRKDYDPKKHLSAPTDIAFLPNGDFYICNEQDARIMKFSKDGTFQMEFGRSLNQY